MIKFNPELLTYKYFYISQVSTHGVIRHFENGEEKKLSCPKYIVQQFKKQNKVSKFKNPKKSCILFYDGYPLSIESPFAIIINQKEKNEFLNNWVSSFEKGIINIKETLSSEKFKDSTPYIDGKFIFILQPNKEAKENEMPYANATLVSDDNFFTIQCSAFNIKTIGSIENEKANSKRMVIAYHTKDQEGNYITAISPTVSGIKYRDRKTKSINFDKMEKSFYVNLNFILNCAKTVGESYGYEAISFLDLEEVLIKMETVNLYSLPDYIRNLTPIQQTFKECISWIIGLSYRENNIQYLLEYRMILAGLLERWLVKRSYIDETLKENIFSDNIEQISVEDLTNKFNKLTDKSADVLFKSKVDTSKFLI